MKRVLLIIAVFYSIAGFTQSNPFLTRKDNRTYYYSTVAAMQADISRITDGAQIITSGYYVAGDGGGNKYFYSSASSATAEGGSVISATTGRFLAAFDGNVIDVRKFGAYGDSTHDDYTAIQATIDYAWSSFHRIGNSSYTGYGIITNVPEVVLGGGKTYLINSTLFIRAGHHIDGANSTLKAGTAGMTMVDMSANGSLYLSGIFGQKDVVVKYLKFDGNNIASLGLSCHSTEMCTFDHILTTRFRGKRWADSSASVVAAASSGGASILKVSDTSGMRVNDFINFWDTANKRFYPGIFQISAISHDTVSLFEAYFSGFIPTVGSYVMHLPAGVALFGNKNHYNEVYGVDNTLGLGFGNSSTSNFSRDDNIYTKCYTRNNDFGVALCDTRSSTFLQCTFMWSTYWSLTIMSAHGSVFINTYLESFSNNGTNFAGRNNEDYTLAAIRGLGIQFGCFVPTNNGSEPWYRPIKVYDNSSIDIDFSGTASGHTWDNPNHTGDHSLVMVQHSANCQVNMIIRNHTLANKDSLKFAVVDQNYNWATNARVRASDPTTFRWNQQGYERFDSVQTGVMMDSTEWRGKKIDSAFIAQWRLKADALVSGTTIKTINGNSILGSGNYNTASGSGGVTKSQSLLISQGLGSTIVAETFPVMNMTSTAVIGTGSLKLYALQIYNDTTISGVKWFQATAGSYTAGSYNGVALYKCNSATGIDSLVASSTNDGAVWTGTANTWQSKNFSSSVLLPAGTYHVCEVYTQTAQVTQPALGQAVAATNAAVGTLDYPNSGKLAGTISFSGASVPSTITLSSVTAVGSVLYFALF